MKLILTNDYNMQKKTEILIDFKNMISRIENSIKKHNNELKDTIDYYNYNAKAYRNSKNPKIQTLIKEFNKRIEAYKQNMNKHIQKEKDFLNEIKNKLKNITEENLNYLEKNKTSLIKKENELAMFAPKPNDLKPLLDKMFDLNNPFDFNF